MLYSGTNNLCLLTDGVKDGLILLPNVETLRFSNQTKPAHATYTQTQTHTHSPERLAFVGLM